MAGIHPVTTHAASSGPSEWWGTFQHPSREGAVFDGVGYLGKASSGAPRANVPLEADRGLARAQRTLVEGSTRQPGR